MIGPSPISAFDNAILEFLLEAQSPSTIIAHLKITPAEFLNWTRRPEIRALLNDLAEFTDLSDRFASYRQRRTALDGLSTVMKGTKDLVEVRRAATTVIRATGHIHACSRPPRFYQTAPAASTSRDRIPTERAGSVAEARPRTSAREAERRHSDLNADRGMHESPARDTSASDRVRPALDVMSIAGTARPRAP